MIEGSFQARFRYKVLIVVAFTFSLQIFILQEFSVFVDKADDSFGASPSTQLGFLQSAFIVGLIAGFSGFGHAVHHVDNVFKLTGLGCGVWVFAVLLSGISYYANSFVCLLIARILSGFGEASLQCTIPPWIQACAPAGKIGNGIFAWHDS